MKNSNSAFYGFLAVLISAGSFFYTWKTILPQYQKVNQEIKAVEEQTAAAKQKLASISKVKTDMDQMGDLVDKLFIAIPEGKDEPNLLTELEALILKLKMQVPTIQLTDSSPSLSSDGTLTGNNTVMISLSVSGSFAQLNELIASLEKDLRFMNIKDVNFSNDDEGELSLALQIEAYKRMAMTAQATP